MSTTMSTTAIRVAIVDDEPLARLAVKLRLAQRSEFALVAEYGDGDSAAAGIAALRPDLVFMDVEMPGRSGLEVLAGLPAAQRPMAILLTAYDSFALQAFELAALDYLLKPVSEERLDEALDRARLAFPYRRADAGALSAPSAPSAAPWTRSFAVRVGARTVLVPAWLVRERLHTLATRLDPRQFLRVHRSSIVRLDMIAELRALTNRDALLRLHDGSLLRASRTYMPALMDALDHLNKKTA
jgi:two-component system LytT family response regulator